MRAYHALPGTTDAHPPCVKRALSGIGIALLLLPSASCADAIGFSRNSELRVALPPRRSRRDSAWAGEEQLAHRLVRGGEVGVGELPDHLIA